MTRRFFRGKRPAFTLVELLVSMAIIALLASLALPALQLALLRAESTQCSEQLHGIGVAVLADATDHSGILPEINQAATPVYPATVPGIVGTLSNYGVTTNSIQCPVDMGLGAASSFTLYGSSYEWNPVLDDGTDPVTALPVGNISVSINPGRVRVCTDFQPIHHGKTNALYGDGHVRAR